MIGLHLLERGGIFFWALFGLSVGALALIVERWLVLRRMAHAAASFTSPQPHLPDWLLSSFPHTARFLSQGGGEEALKRCLALDVHRLEKRLTLIAITARIAPMLGLLGTVSGLMRTFFRIERGGGHVDVATLSQGIWEALITTAAGLVIAVPCLVAHQLLCRMLEGCVLAIEERVAAAQAGLPAAPAAAAQAGLPMERP